MDFSTQKPKPKEVEGCEIEVKRDKHGRVIKTKTRGKCTREDRLIFAKENDITLEDD